MFKNTQHIMAQHNTTLYNGCRMKRWWVQILSFCVRQSFIFFSSLSFHRSFVHSFHCWLILVIEIMNHVRHFIIFCPKRRYKVRWKRKTENSFKKENHWISTTKKRKKRRRNILMLISDLYNRCAHTSYITSYWPSFKRAYFFRFEWWWRIQSKFHFFFFSSFFPNMKKSSFFCCTRLNN